MSLDSSAHAYPGWYQLITSRSYVLRALSRLLSPIAMLLLHFKPPRDCGEGDGRCLPQKYTQPLLLAGPHKASALVCPSPSPKSPFRFHLPPTKQFKQRIRDIANDSTRDSTPGMYRVSCETGYTISLTKVPEAWDRRGSPVVAASASTQQVSIPKKWRPVICTLRPLATCLAALLRSRRKIATRTKHDGEQIPICEATQLRHGTLAVVATCERANS